MTTFPRRLAWREPPLALQIMGLLLGGLVVAQVVTLLLTLVLPPEPPAKYGLDDIASALRGGRGGASGLRRSEQATDPNVAGRGWLLSPTSRNDLARLLAVSPDRVVLAFYTPLPFAGTAAPAGPARATQPPLAASAQRAVRPSTSAEPPTAAWVRPAVLLSADLHPTPLQLMRIAQVGPGPALPGGPPVGLPGGGFPGGGFPGGALPRGGFPGGGFPAGGPAGGGSSAASPVPTVPSARTAAPGATPPAAQPNAPPPTLAAPPSTPSPPINALPPAILVQPLPGPAASGQPADGSAAEPVVPDQVGTSERSASVTPPARTDRPASAAEGDRPAAAAPATTAPPAPSPAEQAAGPVPAPRANEAARPQRSGLSGAIDRARSLFGLAPAPFVEGDFVAAVRLRDGRWLVVQPRADALLSPWQKRVALWFLLAFGIVAPIGWLFARRLSRPLGRFAAAAAQLGRDPSVAIAALDGPAEIGRAAHAFNLMQQRLRSFVDDRTAMVGAISHDLRTPLTRLRFRIEDVPDDLQAGLLGEVNEMEAMITSVLAFIRDASTPGVRERLDLRALLDDVVEDAAVVGALVPVTAVSQATVEVDVLGMRRVLANLVENALKYGKHARIELTLSHDEAVAAVIDDGPGLADEELEHVFEPFYRTAEARASGAPGTGLGLAVCRSIARAHGGDVRLRRGADGFRAEVRVPLAYDALRAAA